MSARSKSRLDNTCHHFVSYPVTTPDSTGVPYTDTLAVSCTYNCNNIVHFTPANPGSAGPRSESRTKQPSNQRTPPAQS